MDILRIVLSILLPPLAVFLTIGLGLHFWINIILTLLGGVPGMITPFGLLLRIKKSRQSVHEFLLKRIVVEI